MDHDRAFKIIERIFVALIFSSFKDFGIRNSGMFPAVGSIFGSIEETANLHLEQLFIDFFALLTPRGR